MRVVVIGIHVASQDHNGRVIVGIVRNPLGG
jgi:hypothetical protein